MLPSSTVENYLKAIHHGQSSLPKGQRLLPMGHVAAALSVTPGTATTMVKTLAESGLVEYEPYGRRCRAPAARQSRTADDWSPRGVQTAGRGRHRLACCKFD